MGSRLFVIDNTDTISVESYFERFALEESVFNDVTAIFKDIVPRLSDSLMNTLRSIKNINNDDIALNRDFLSREPAIFSKIDKLNYIEIGRTLISVPQGFKGNFLEYNKTLSSISGSIYSNATQILQEYHVIISSFITNKENQTYVKDYSDLFDRVSGTRESLTADIAKYFDKGNTASKAYIKDVFNRMEDVKELMNVTKGLFSSHQQANIKSISDSIVTTVGMLNIIIKQMQSQDITKVSAKAAKNIAAGAYEIGKYIELVSLFYQSTNIALSCTDYLVSVLKKIPA